MDIEFLLVEDLGARTAAFSRAVEVANAELKPRVAVTPVESVERLLDDFPISRLASFDAFLIDFHLNTRRVRSSARTLPIACGNSMGVTIETGMGVLLYLRSVLESADYRAHRQEVLKSHPRRRLQAQMFTFGGLDDVWPKFYAASGRLWFGTRHLDARVTVAGTVSTIKHLHRQITAGAPMELPDRTNTRVFSAAGAFALLLDAEYLRRADWTYRELTGGRRIPVIREAFDWYGVYLGAGGRIGGLGGLRRALMDRWGLDCPTSLQLKNQYGEPVAQPLQRRLVDFLTAYSPHAATDSWPLDWATTGPDPMNDVLTASKDFWFSQDVRAALMDYRFRNGRVVTPGPRVEAL